MSERQLRDEALTLFIAGYTTLGAGLAWIWYLLSKHPAADEKLGEELGRVLGGREPTFEGLAALSYTRMVVDEVLRLYPPTWIISRYPLLEDEIGGYRIGEKSALLTSPYVIHRHPAFWENPELFDPERFSPRRSATRPHYVYLPFGGGPRVCVGKAWALMEVQLILAMVAQRYRLEWNPACPVAPVAKFMLRPKGRLMMKVHERSLR